MIAITKPSPKEIQKFVDEALDASLESIKVMLDFLNDMTFAKEAQTRLAMAKMEGYIDIAMDFNMPEPNKNDPRAIEIESLMAQLQAHPKFNIFDLSPR